MFRPAHIRRYVHLMQARGFDAATVLAGSGIGLDRLDDAACLVDLEQCQAVVNNMIRLTADTGLGFAFGKASRIIELGIVSHAFVSSRTMRQVVALWVQYGNSLVGSLLQLGVEEHDGGDWSIRVVDSGVCGSIYAFSVEDLLCFGTNIGSQLAGEPFVARSLAISYPRPPHAALYEDTFKCPIQFDAPETRIRFSSPGIDQLLRSDDDVINDICVRHCHHVMRQIANQSPLISRLRSTFLKKPDALPSMAQIAAELGISTSTLRRRLSEEGTRYQALLDQFRHEMAIEYLKELTPKEVAYLLGFRFPTTFRRAFLAWTGQTIGDYLKTPKMQ